MFNFSRALDYFFVFPSCRLIPAKSQVQIQLHVSECSGVNYMEHVQVTKIKGEVERAAGAKVGEGL